MLQLFNWFHGRLEVMLELVGAIHIYQGSLLVGGVSRFGSARLHSLLGLEHRARAWRTTPSIFCYWFSRFASLEITSLTFMIQLLLTLWPWLQMQWLPLAPKAPVQSLNVMNVNWHCPLWLQKRCWIDLVSILQQIDCLHFLQQLQWPTLQCIEAPFLYTIASYQHFLHSRNFHTSSWPIRYFAHVHCTEGPP